MFGGQSEGSQAARVWHAHVPTCGARSVILDCVSMFSAWPRTQFMGGSLVANARHHCKK